MTHNYVAKYNFEINCIAFFFVTCLFSVGIYSCIVTLKRLDTSYLTSYERVVTSSPAEAQQQRNRIISPEHRRVAHVLNCARQLHVLNHKHLKIPGMPTENRTWDLPCRNQECAPIRGYFRCNTIVFQIRGCGIVSKHEVVYRCSNALTIGLQTMKYRCSVMHKKYASFSRRAYNECECIMSSISTYKSLLEFEINMVWGFALTVVERI